MSGEFVSFIEKRRRRRRRLRAFKKLGLFLIGVVVFLFLAKQVHVSPFRISGLADPGGKGSNVMGETVSKSLEEIVQKELEGTQGIYAVYIKNLKTQETYFLNEHREFEAGSLYKLWVMGEAFDQIKKGELKEDEELSEDIADLNRKFSIDPDYAEQTEGGITLTVAQALNQMITISHNYAALLLADRLKLSQVKDYLEKNGFKESQVGNQTDPPFISAADGAMFLEKIYRASLSSTQVEQMVDKESADKMLALLKNQKLNNKLPKYLPEGAVIAHKTGEIGWFSHDSGIVFSDKGDYIVVVLSESSKPAAAEDRIGKISKAVYDYFQ